MTGRRLNWHGIRAAYVEGALTDPQRDAFARTYPTLEEVAVVNGVGYSSVKTRAGRERWVEQREEFQQEVERERRRWLLDQRVERSTTIDSRGLTNAEAGLALVGIRLTHLIVRENQHPENSRERGRELDARELAALGLAAKRFIDVKAHVMGQPSTAPEETLDELERVERVEVSRLAEDLAAFIEQRRSEEAAEV